MNRLTKHIITLNIILFSVVGVVFGQSTFNGSNIYVTSEFKSDDVNIKQGEIASNVLLLTNEGDKAERIYIDLSYPYGWKSLSVLGKVYEIQPKDTMYIPCTVIPTGIINGNTKFFISAIVFSEEGQQLTGSKYTVSTKKVVNWDLKAVNGKKNYLKNDEDTKNFGLNIFNIGNFDQEMLFTVNELRDDIIISDSNNRILDKVEHNLKLKPWQDTTFYFNAKYLQSKRNYRKIDIDSHSPKKQNSEKKFSVLAKTIETSVTGSKKRYTKNERIDFIKLTNEKQLSGLGGNIFPLTVDMNVYGLFQDFTVMSLGLQGMKQFDNENLFIYSANAFYTQGEYSTNYLDDLQGFLGYYFKKGNVQLGTINGGITGLAAAGRGIKGEYEINKKHTVGGFFSRAPRFFSDANRTSYGANHKFTYGENRVLNSFIGQSIRNDLNLTSTVGGTSTSIRLQRKHLISVSLIGAISERLDENRNVNQFFGYTTRLGYRSHFFDKNGLQMLGFITDLLNFQNLITNRLP